MKVLFLLWGLTVVCAFVSGCASLPIALPVVISLREVERPLQAKERYGEQKITTVEEEGVSKYCFEDEMVRILWLPTVNSFISFTITNKTDHSIRIIWDEAVYVDVSGGSHKVMHAGVKYMDRYNAQLPSVVVRKGWLSDIILPVDNVYYVDSGGWKESPLLPNVEKYIGKTIQVLLPLEIEGIVHEYIFVFNIDRAGMPPPPPSTKETSEKMPGSPLKRLVIFGVLASVLFLSYVSLQG